MPLAGYGAGAGRRVGRHEVADTATTALHKRLTDLKAATAEHAQLLNTSMDDTGAALRLGVAQLASQLAQAGDA